MKHNIIQFPVPKVTLTEEETKEYNELKRKVRDAKTIREIRHVKKQVRAFLDKVHGKM